MHAAAAERGGPFGRKPVMHRDAAESSPLGGRRIAQRAASVVIAALLVGGIACFGDAAWIHAKAHLGQWLLQRAWETQRDTGERVKPWPWADTFPVARLSVPRADAGVLVLAGASGRTLAWGPGHLDDSAPLGNVGNAVVSAHRDTHFRFLRGVAVGDEIVVDLASGGRVTYRVRDTFVADARTLRLPRNTDVPTLTLITCYPFDAVVPGGPLRYIVVAESL